MDGRTGIVICAQCGVAGHTMGKCPDRLTAATTEWAHPVAADVPRRCSCGAATLHTLDGRILNDGYGADHADHVCAFAVRAA